MNIHDFIMKNNNNKIKKDPVDVLYKLTSYCDEELGKGYFGKVSVPKIGDKMKVK